MTRTASHRTASHGRGMTLMEIMIAMVIMGLMMLIAWSTIKSASEARISFEAMEDRNQEIRLGLSRMVHDLESAYLSKNEDRNLDDKRTTFVGKEDEVRFSSFGHLTLWSDSNESDQTVIAYYLDDDRQEGAHGDALYRKELRRPSNEDWETEPGELDILIHDITKFELEYWDWQDKKWQHDWDANKADAENGRLPTRVKIKITYKNPRGDEVVISTQARLILEEQLQF